MTVLDRGKPGFTTDPVAAITDKLGIENPLARQTPPAPPNDYPDGFQIFEFDGDERLPGGEGREILNEVSLSHNLTPHIPFSYSGGQRISKDYYPGNSEPVMQVLGAIEEDITINGDLKDINYRTAHLGVSYEIMETLDRIRERGNLCRFVLGEWARYGYISNARFDIERKTRIKYELSLRIVGKNDPDRDKFVSEDRRPSEADAENIRRLFTAIQGINAPFSQLPNQTIAEFINSQTSFVQERINLVTDFIDGVFTTVDNIRQSVNRALGIIGGLQRQLRRYRQRIGAINFFEPGVSLATGYRYQQTANASISASARLSGLLERLRQAVAARLAEIPLATYTVIQGDTLQKISNRFYGHPNNWKLIQDENALVAGIELEQGTILDIPRVNA